MAPRTNGGLAGGMAYGGHIHRENYGFIGAKGQRPRPLSAAFHTSILEIWVPWLTVDTLLEPPSGATSQSLPT